MYSMVTLEKKKIFWHLSVSIFKHLNLLFVLNYSNKITSHCSPLSWDNIFLRLNYYWTTSLLIYIRSHSATFG